MGRFSALGKVFRRHLGTSRKHMNVPRDSRALTAALLTAALIALAGCEPLGPDELQREVETIQSTAAEGAVLADQIAGQRTKRTFARVHARELGDSADHSAERLTDAAPAQTLVTPAQRAITLAERTADALGQLEVAPDDARAAEAAAARLRALAAKAAGLAGSL
jgi:hypothetical protein